MELSNSAQHNRTLVRLENDSEARLFASEGIGLFSIKGIRFAFDVIKAQTDNQWPVEVTVSNNRLKHAANRMSDEANRLGVVGALPGFGEYPDAVENEITLRSMADTISGHLEPAKS